MATGSLKQPVSYTTIQGKPKPAPAPKKQDPPKTTVAATGTGKKTSPGGISNVIDVYKTIFTGGKLQTTIPGIPGQIVVAAAEHPFITAGIATGGIMAAKGALSAGAAGVAKAAVPSSVKTAALVGGGILGGAFLGGFLGGGSKQSQGLTQTQDQNTNPQQTQKQDTKQAGGKGYLGGEDTISNSPGARIYRTQKQIYPTTNYSLPEQAANQTVEPSLSASGELGQTATSQPGSNWLMLAVAAIAAIVLVKKTR